MEREQVVTLQQRVKPHPPRLNGRAIAPLRAA
jgi:hypothetical protein